MEPQTQKLVFLVGPTGVGKSTMINSIGCTEQAFASNSTTSVTSIASCYTCKDFPDLLLVDTAGLGDNKGKPDAETMSEILLLARPQHREIAGIILMMTANSAARIDNASTECIAFISKLNPQLVTRVIIMFPHAKKPQQTAEIYKKAFPTDARVVFMNPEFDDFTSSYDTSDIKKQLEIWKDQNGFRPIPQSVICQRCGKDIDPRIYEPCYNHPGCVPGHAGPYEYYHPSSWSWYHPGSWESQKTGRVWAGIFTLGISEAASWGYYRCCRRSDSGCQKRYLCCYNNGSGCQRKCLNCYRNVNESGCVDFCKNCGQRSSVQGCLKKECHPK